MSWRLAVRAEFSAAHYLRHYHGKCENPHGHNYQVEACVQGNELDERSGMLLDFGLLKKILRGIIAPFDHADLNAIQPFDVISPSAENLARHIGEKLTAALAQLPEGANVSLYSVSVSEKAAQTATWFAPNWQTGKNSANFCAQQEV